MNWRAERQAEKQRSLSTWFAHSSTLLCASMCVQLDCRHLCLNGERVGVHCAGPFGAFIHQSAHTFSEYGRAVFVCHTRHLLANSTPIDALYLFSFCLWHYYNHCTPHLLMAEYGSRQQCATQTQHIMWETRQIFLPRAQRPVSGSHVCASVSASEFHSSVLLMNWNLLHVTQWC